MKKIFLLFIILLTACSKQETELDVKILDQKEEYAQDVYYIKNDVIEEAGFQKLTRFNNYLLSSFEYFDQQANMLAYKVRLISVEDGNVFKEATFHNLEFPVLYENDRYISIKDLSSGKFILLDQELNIVKEYQCDVSSTYMNQDASLLYHFTNKPGIQVQDLKTNQTKTIYDHYSFISVLNECDQYLVISYFNNDTLLDEFGLFDMNKQTITTYKCDYALGYIDYGHNTYIGKLLAIDNEYMINNQFFSLNAPYPMLEMQDNEYFSVEYMKDDKLVIDLYDLKGNLVSQAVIKDATTTPESPLVYFKEIKGYLFVVSDKEGIDHLYYWQINDSNKGTLEYHEISYLSSDELQQTIYQQIEDIKDKYGVNIIVGNNGDEEFYNYDVVKTVDNDILKKALKTVEEALSLYPDSFLQQLGYSYYRQLDIYLVDQIEYSNREDEFDHGNVIGFSQTGDGKYNIVLEASYDLLASTLHHEICHIIDDKIIFASHYHDDLKDYESKWHDFNPKGFEYPNRYNDLPDYIYDDDYTSYFIDYYSMTYQKEDKARIFENVMSGNKEYFESQHLKDKLDYLSQSIRKVFDLPAEVKWEL